MAVKVRSGSAAHHSNCTRLLCSKYPQSTRETEMRQAQTERLTRSKDFARSRTNATAPRSSSFALHKTFPSPSRPPTRFVGLLHPCHLWRPQSTRYFCCQFSTSGVLNASRQRINVGMGAIGISLVTFFGIKKKIVVQACCGFVPPSPRLPRFLLLFLASNPRGLWDGSHRVLLLFSPCTISMLFAVRTLLALEKASSTFFNSSFSKACPSSSARSHHTASAFPILPSLLRNDPTTLHPPLLSLGPVSTIGTVSFLQ